MFVSRIELTRSKLSNFSVHVSGVTDCGLRRLHATLDSSVMLRQARPAVSQEQLRRSWCEDYCKALKY